MLKGSLERTFIHHDGALGDILLSLPCIRRIKESASAVHIAAQSEISGFLLASGVVDETSSANSALFTSLYTDSPDRFVRSFLSSFDNTYIFTVNADSSFCDNIKKIVRNVRTIVTIPPRESSIHIAMYRLSQCAYGPDEATKGDMLSVPEGLIRWAGELLEKKGFSCNQHLLITIHPGSGGKRKCWPLEHYATLIRLLVMDPRFYVLILSGPAEERETIGLPSDLAMHNKRIIHLHNEPLIRVATMIERSNFYLGNDSGISHLAGIMKCRGVVLFGPTDPSIWRPLGESLEILRFDAEEPSDTVSAEKIFHDIITFFSSDALSNAD